MSNILSFDRLQEGLQKLSDIGLIEETVEVHGTKFCLRTLRTRDHKKVNSFVGAYMEQYEGEESAYPLDATMDFFTVRKIEPLSHSIQAIDNLDLHGIDYIETGSVDENGNQIKKEKHVFIREMLQGMDISVIEVLHRKYADMLVEAEEKAAEKIKFRDPEEELKKVEARRKELYKELKRELPVEKAPATKVEKAPSSEDNLTVDALKKASFTPVPTEEADELVRSREESRNPLQEDLPTLDEEPESTPEKEQSFEAGGQKFVRLDDPDTPYTEEELVYVEEQERMFQQRFGEDGPAAEAKAKLQQKRRRQPLNQTAPEIHEGNLPSHEARKAPNVQKGSSINPSDLTIAEGFEEEASTVLGPKTQGKQKAPYNPQPSGNRNPNFDPKK